MARQRGNRTLSLFPQTASDESTTTVTRVVGAPLPTHARSRKLWIAVRLPRLPLSVFAVEPGLGMHAVVDGEGMAKTVLAPDAAAFDAGIAPGLGLNAAYALAPDLKIFERDPRRERRVLKRLAAWCIGFTPVVSLNDPDTLLLEVRGSLGLFGGLDTLCERLVAGLAELGHESVPGVASTPLGAIWLSRDDTDRVVADETMLPGRLGALPLRCTGWPDRVLATLDGMGLATVRDCMRLPRDGFARRIGKNRLADLDRALGRCPDPREAFVPPQRFRAMLDLPAEAPDIAGIEPAARRLFAELGGFLRGRQGGVQSLRLTLYHQDVPATDVHLGLLAPDRDPARLEALFGERLERVTLPAPVIAIALRSGRVLPLPGRDAALFGAARESSGNMPQLIERLRARLGANAASSLCLVPEHRPESAWRSVEPGQVREMAVSAARPFWLLAQPRKLEVRDGRPQCDGALHFDSGPERIETGWWDGRDVARDYYIAVNADGMRLWIYRERRAPRRWYLHGIF